MDAIWAILGQPPAIEQQAGQLPDAMGTGRTRLLLDDFLHGQLRLFCRQK